MSEDQFTKLFTHMNRRFDELTSDINGQLAHVNHRIDDIYTVLDSMNNRLDAIEVEFAAMSVQDDRQTDWIKQLASVTSTQLVPEA